MASRYIVPGCLRMMKRVKMSWELNPIATPHRPGLTFIPCWWRSNAAPVRSRDKPAERNTIGACSQSDLKFSNIRDPEVKPISPWPYRPWCVNRLITHHRNHKYLWIIGRVATTKPKKELTTPIRIDEKAFNQLRFLMRMNAPIAMQIPTTQDAKYSWILVRIPAPIPKSAISHHLRSRFERNLTNKPSNSNEPRGKAKELCDQ